MDQVELKLLKTQIHQTLVWSRYIYIYDIFYTWTHGQDNLDQFLADFNKSHPTL